MIFNGIAKVFPLTDEAQYETIGGFWDEMAAQYGRESLMGLGYLWQNGKISYAIGLKTGDIQDYTASIVLPDDGWETVTGQTQHLKELYDELYRDGPLQYEIETFYDNGTCEIRYFRAPQP